MIELLQAFDKAVTDPGMTDLWIPIIAKSAIILVTTFIFITIVRRLDSAVRTVIMSASFTISLLMPVLIFAVPSRVFTMVGTLYSRPMIAV